MTHPIWWSVWKVIVSLYFTKGARTNDKTNSNDFFNKNLGENNAFHFKLTKYELFKRFKI